MSNTCPNCRGTRIGKGDVQADPVFLPGPLRSFTLVLQNGVLADSRRFWACLDCGHLWGTIDPARLRHFIVDHCGDDTRARWGLTENDSSPPATTSGGQTISPRVRQIAGDPTRKIEAIKAYRDETGVSLAEAKAAIEALLDGK